MADYHADRAALELQRLFAAKNAGVIVRAISKGVWTFDLDKASMSLQVLPGCCGIMLLRNLNGPDKQVLKLIRLATKAAYETRFGLVLMSLKSISPVRKKLIAPEWTAVPFTNPRTGNAIEVLHYVVPQKPRKVKKITDHEERF